MGWQRLRQDLATEQRKIIMLCMATHASILAWRIMDRGAWQATVHKVAKSWTQIKQLSTHALMHACAFCLNRLNIPLVENLGNGRKEEKKR